MGKSGLLWIRNLKIGDAQITPFKIILVLYLKKKQLLNGILSGMYIASYLLFFNIVEAFFSEKVILMTVAIESWDFRYQR